MSDEPSGRQVVPFNAGWKFLKSDLDGAASPDFDDSGWEDVNVPHDWAIQGPFDKNNDRQVTKVIEDGEERLAERIGRTGCLPHVGQGWYRKSFSVRGGHRGKRLFIECDGIMANSEVYLNGEFVGAWPYGYASFCFELTEHIQFDDENVLAVRVDVKPNASRWYPGAGIYRNVRLVIVNPVHVAHWGTYITTPEISDSRATARVQTDIQNQSGRAGDVKLKTEIMDPLGRLVAAASSQEHIVSSTTFEQTFCVDDPMLWSNNTPHLYKAVSSVIVSDKIVDHYETTFGIREIRFDPNEGFLLNGQRLRLNGVCMHHDLGPLGAAVNRRAIERQWEILTEMGCNALRTSHNPHAPEVLETCDRMGILVIDEAFDEWRWAKCENGYNSLFDEWAERDLRAMIKRDRNHPSVIMWSIGNEIREQGQEDGGAEVAQFLTDICHDEDPTRPTTAGFNRPDEAIKNGLADAVDIPGLNYRHFKYEEYHRDHPDWVLYGSETASTVSTRGEYHFPMQREEGDEAKRETQQVSSYDLASPEWGYLPDDEFAAQDACPFIFGEFVWTGFDYLGEPTPYNREWPSRSSYFGIVDLCGLPKDRYYLYRSKWSEKATLHLLPHWNWEGREGEITPVYCYTNFDAAELFLNGKSLGVRRKERDSTHKRYRIVWDDVKYEPGTLRVVALDSEGNPAVEKEVRTAGSPAQIELLPDRTEITADGQDLSYITVKVTDAEGNLCPLADNLVHFDLEGPGKIAAVGNGDATSTEPFVAPHRKAFHGMCMLILCSDAGATGRIRVTAASEGLRGASALVVTS